MASNSPRKSDSSARSRSRKKVVIAPGPPRRDSATASTVGAKAATRTPAAKAEARTPGAKRDGRGGGLLSRDKRRQREERLTGARRERQVRVGLIAAAAVIVLVGVVAVWRSSTFPVRRVVVEGNHQLSTAQVLALANVPKDATLLRFPGGAVRQRLLTNPWIASARVSRVLPDGMRLHIEERLPSAKLDVKSSFWLVDSSGLVLGRVPVTGFASLPVVRDVEGLKPKAGEPTRSSELKNALDVLAGISTQLRSTVRVVSAPSIDKTALYTADGIEIFFGEATDLEKKDVVARRIMQEQKGKVVSINVRTTDRPTWHGLGD